MKWLLIIAAVASFGIQMARAQNPSIAQAPKALSVGEAVDGVLEAGTRQPFTLALRSGDYVRLSSTPGLLLSLYLPSGEKYRTFQPAVWGKIATVSFVAEPTGTYRVELSGASEAKGTPFRLLVEGMESLDHRMTLIPPSDPIQSSRLKT